MCSRHLTIEYGNCCGNGQKEGIQTNIKMGLSINIGKEALPESGISEQNKESYCFCQKQRSVDTFL
jgi:hypothetical protein